MTWDRLDLNAAPVAGEKQQKLTHKDTPGQSNVNLRPELHHVTYLHIYFSCIKMQQALLHVVAVQTLF